MTNSFWLAREPQDAAQRLHRIELVSRWIRYAILSLLSLSAGSWLLALFWSHSSQWEEASSVRIGLGFFMEEGRKIQEEQALTV